MKSRQGFVSNSSSSSFVVAFPKKPKSFDDVYKMMFNSKEGGIQPFEHSDGMSHSQVAHRVWEDIKREYIGKTSQNTISLLSVSEKNIIKCFANRYHYYAAGQNFFWHERETDELGGAWSEKIGSYYGSDIEKLNNLRDFIIKAEKEEKEILVRQRKILEEEFKIPRPSYAYKGGKDSKTNKPYTNKEVKAYRSYEDTMNDFIKEHQEYVSLQNKLTKLYSEKYKKEDILRKKIAKADAMAFIGDNKKSFIVTLSYSDNNGDSTLEHGNIFKNVPHVKISNH